MSEKSKLSWLPGSTRRQRHRLERQVKAQLPALTRLARGLLRNPIDAEDLVHDCCVKALTAGDDRQFENDAKLNAWLSRILVNTYRDQYRRNQRSPFRATDYHAASDDSMNVYELVASTEPTPVDCMHHRDSSSAIQDALASLPPEARVVSLLFLVNAMSYREIAWIADCPLGTVMSRLSRGRKLLRERLADFDPRKLDPHATEVAGGDTK